MAGASSARRYDMDWLRIIGMIGVFLYHGGMFFNPWDWHVKNVETSYGFAVYCMLISPWIMPLFFITAGMGTYYALLLRSGGAFLKERVLRLIVPMLFGAFILSPHQVYIERVTKGVFAGSFFDFFPRHYFEGWYTIGNGNFAWMGLHLWFLLVLFVFSAVLLPVLLCFRSDRMQRFFDKAGRFAQNPVGLLCFAVPLFLVADGPGTGGFSYVLYLILFLYGVSVLPQESFRVAVRRNGVAFLIVGAVVSIFVAVWYGGDPNFTTPDTMYFALRALSCWTMLIGLFWIGERFLQRSNGTLKTWTPLVLVFYVLHQPVVVLVAYLSREWAWPLVVKYVYLVGVSFVVILALIWVVQRVKVLQFLVGMKGARRVGREVAPNLQQHQ